MIHLCTKTYVTKFQVYEQWPTVLIVISSEGLKKILDVKHLAKDYPGFNDWLIHSFLSCLFFLSVQRLTHEESSFPTRKILPKIKINHYQFRECTMLRDCTMLRECTMTTLNITPFSTRINTSPIIHQLKTFRSRNKEGKIHVTNRISHPSILQQTNDLRKLTSIFSTIFMRKVYVSKNLNYSSMRKRSETIWYAFILLLLI